MHRASKPTTRKVLITVAMLAVSFITLPKGALRAINHDCFPFAVESRAIRTGGAFRGAAEPGNPQFVYDLRFYPVHLRAVARLLAHDGVYASAEPLRESNTTAITQKLLRVLMSIRLRPRS